MNCFFLLHTTNTISRMYIRHITVYCPTKKQNCPYKMDSEPLFTSYMTKTVTYDYDIEDLHVLDFDNMSADELEGIFQYHLYKELLEIQNNQMAFASMSMEHGSAQTRAILKVVSQATITPLDVAQLYFFLLSLSLPIPLEDLCVWCYKCNSPRCTRRHFLGSITKRVRVAHNDQRIQDKKRCQNSTHTMCEYGYFCADAECMDTHQSSLLVEKNDLPKLIQKINTYTCSDMEKDCDIDKYVTDLVSERLALLKGQTAENWKKFKSNNCKAYDTPEGCSFGVNCAFAHGPHESNLYCRAINNIVFNII